MAVFVNGTPTPVTIISNQPSLNDSGNDSGSGITGATTTRVIVSGTASINAGSTVTVATFIATATERHTVLGYINDNVPGAQFYEGPTSASSDSVNCWLERTANPSEVNLKARNNNDLASRTLRYAVLGIAI